MRKLSVLVALIAGASLFALLAPGANALGIVHATGSVTCPASGQHFSGTMTVSGKSLNNKHQSGPRDATFEVRNVACTTDNVSGTNRNWSIDSADIKGKLPIASTTCDGLNTALTLGTGSVYTLAKFKHDLVIGGFDHRVSAASASGHKVVSAGTAGDSISVPLISADFRGETATLTIDSHTVHCDGKHKSTVDFTAALTVG